LLDLLTGRSRRRFGWLPDLLDARDRRFAELDLPERVPLEATLLTKPVAIADQNGTGSCVGQAVAQGVRMAYRVGNSEPCPTLSALFVYFNARKLGGEKLVDDGTTLRNGIKAVQKFGICPETEWPFAKAAVNRMPDWAAFRYAHDRRGVRGYYRIDDGDLLAVKRAIANRRPVVAGWQVSPSFVAHRGATVVGGQQTPFVGGHAMVVAGYTVSSWRIVNS
jgi:hypothetical protein